MTTATANIYQDGSTSAQWVAMGKGFSDLLTAVGVVKTADTGQIDWSTVSRPASQTTSVGYEIREIPTTVGTLRVKIDYGTGASTQQNYQWKLTFGTGSNGSGTITGAFGAEQTFSPNGYTWNYTVSPMLCYASSWDGGFAIVMWLSYTTESYRVAFVFDQSCDSSGALTNDGYFWAAVQNGKLETWGWSATLGARGQFTTFPARIPYHYRDTALSAVLAGKRRYSAVRQMTPIPVWHPNVIVGWASDCASGATFSLTVLGEERTYLSLGAFYAGINGNLASSSSDYTGALCIRWEE